MSYGRFVAMIVTSTVIMFGLMYLNTYALDHVTYSQTRNWMALLMGAVMAIVMIGCMWSMYKSRTANAIIVAASVVDFAGSLWLVRSEETVSDVSYMNAMIPHHSIAIMTSERAYIRDPRMRKLADGIIDASARNRRDEIIDRRSGGSSRPRQCARPSILSRARRPAADTVKCHTGES